MNKNGNFKSTVGFVLACVGSAVGMGNIWMFPYRLGQYGGAAFLIPYLIFIALICVRKNGKNRNVRRLYILLEE